MKSKLNVKCFFRCSMLKLICGRAAVDELTAQPLLNILYCMSINVCMILSQTCANSVAKLNDKM